MRDYQILHFDTNKVKKERFSVQFVSCHFRLQFSLHEQL